MQNNADNKLKQASDELNNRPVTPALSLAPVFIRPEGHKYAKIAQEFSTARYSLTPLELKAWILFIASIGKPEQEGADSIYVFDALAFADKLDIDKRKARGRIIADIFVRLSQNSIDMRSRLDKKGEQSIFHSNFISSVDYNSRTYRLEIAIPTKLRPYLFQLKTGTFMSLDVHDILQLETIVALRVFIYLKGLDNHNQYTVSVNDFRHYAGFEQPFYNKFYELKRKVLYPAIREIRKHTEYKDFFIEDNGHRGKKATLLHFGFVKEDTCDDLFLNTSASDDIAKRIVKKFSPSVQFVIRLAMEHGFDPKYIEDKFDGLDNELVIANFNYVLDIIWKDQKKGKPKDNKVYGRYFLTAVRENWAEKNDCYHEMLQRGKAREKTSDAEKQIKEAQERDNYANLSEYYLRQAKQFVDSMNFSELDTFIKKNIVLLDNLAGRNSFSPERALTKKKNFREYRILVQVVSGKMIAGEITPANDQTLF